jgi:hypothetical protein
VARDREVGSLHQLSVLGPLDVLLVVVAHVVISQFADVRYCTPVSRAVLPAPTYSHSVDGSGGTIAEENLGP